MYLICEFFNNTFITQRGVELEILDPFMSKVHHYKPSKYKNLNSSLLCKVRFLVEINFSTVI
jgi:hypothetical protein